MLHSFNCFCDDFKINQCMCFAKNLFLAAFFSALILRTIGIYSLLSNTIDSCLFSSVSILGCLILLFQAIFLEKLKKVDKLLVLFFFASIISCIVNLKYEVWNNFKELIWSALSFFLVYSPDNDNEKIIEIFKKVIIILCFFVSALSIIDFIIQQNYILYFENKTIFIGFIENRLYGLYFNPNVASKLALLSILFSIELILSQPKKTKFQITAIIVQFIYISLSWSRVVTVALSIVTALISLVFFYQYKIKKFLKSLSLSLFLGLSSVLLNKLCRLIFSFIPPMMSKVFGISGIPIENINMVRSDIVRNGISNLRFKIWLSAWDLFKTSPIFGTSPRGIVKYAQNVIPETFIAIKNYQFMHNIFFGAFVYTGVLGSVFIISFFIKKIIIILKFYKKKSFKMNSLKFDFMILSLFAVAVYSLFEQEIIFTNTINCLIFWLFLSEIVRFVKLAQSKEFFEKIGELS
ncbi:MAG: O-antigen ligase family protein [Oscillospiraceae bacterium]|jgi:O-antigen ligase|nr:O-antigen ligase family protein [Oscillospiraceae bacterium]